MFALSKRSVAFAAAILLAGFSQPVVAQTDLSLNVTADNEYTVYVDTFPNNTTGTQVADGNNWEATSSASGIALDPGVVNYIHVVGRNTGDPGSNNPAAFIGDFTLSNTEFEFDNNAQSLLTGVGGWTVNASSFGAAGAAPVSQGLRLSAPWAPTGAPGINDAAHWIWDAAFADPWVVNTPLYFTAVINPADADLGITKTDNVTSAVAGQDSLVYVVTATNHGPGYVADGAMTDTFPSGLACTYTTGATGGATGFLPGGGGPINAILDGGLDMPVNSTITWTFTCPVPADFPATAQGNLVNTATINSPTINDPGPINDNGIDRDTAIVRESDLSITKTALPDPNVVAGNQVSYTLTVSNAGPSYAADVDVVDTLPPAGGVYNDAASTAACSLTAPGVVTCPVAVEMDTSTPAVFTIVLDIPTNTAHGTILANNAAVDLTRSSSTDSTPATVGPVNTTVVTEATWDVTKIWDGGEVDVQLTCGGSLFDNTTTSGLTATLTATGFVDGVNCIVTETVPLGDAPTYVGDCDVSTVSGGAYTCAITNSTSEARIHVTKWFSDFNESEVTATVLCNDGFISQDGVAQVVPGPIGHTFIITDFVDGALDCTVTESGGPDGYTTMPLLGFEFLGMDSETGFYQANFTNMANDAEYAVTKEWMITNDGGNVVREDVYVTIECTSPIDQPYDFVCLNGCGSYNYKSAWLGDGDTLTASVSTLTGPAMCKAYEDEVQSGVDVENGCEKYETLTAGEEYGCTIYNSVFFEGIPTLSQYGLALMALLMLGVGFIGFRRFI